MSETPTCRYRAIIEYDGSEFSGFQKQSTGIRTVQGEIEISLAKLAKKRVVVHGAGRTDTGVHATGQVIAFDLAWKHPTFKLMLALNSSLPDDVSLRKLEVVSNLFHPRFSAKRRAYKYVIEPIAKGDRRPLTRLRHWQVRDSLDLEQMNRAAEYLLGEQDFGTFGRPPQGDNSVRAVFQSFWQEENGLLVYRIEANAFLYRMVRSTVGSLKKVGDGSWTVEKFVEALGRAERSESAAVAPAHGLYLASVTYEE